MNLSIPSSPDTRHQITSNIQHRTSNDHHSTLAIRHFWLCPVSVEELHAISVDQFLHGLDVVKAIADSAVEFRLRCANFG